MVGASEGKAPAGFFKGSDVYSSTAEIKDEHDEEAPPGPKKKRAKLKHKA